MGKDLTYHKGRVKIDEKQLRGLVSERNRYRKLLGDCSLVLDELNKLNKEIGEAMKEFAL